MREKDPRHDAEAAILEAEAEAERAEARLEEAARALRDHAARAARDTGRILHDEANDRVSGAFDSAAEGVERAAASLDEIAGEHEAARPLSDMSAFLESTARGLRGSDLDTVTRGVGAFARDRPLTFMAGAAALGFALGRLAVAGGERRHEDDEAEDRDAYDRDRFDPDADPRGRAEHARWPNAAQTPPATTPGASPAPAPGAPGAAETEAQPERASVTGGAR
jgi:hypothetical protein